MSTGAASTSLTYWQKKRVCVTGGAGFLGQAVCARLRALEVRELIVPRSAEYDLTDGDAVRRLFKDTSPDLVLHLAAEVGGIGANQKHPGRFFYANMAMGIPMLEQARLHEVDKFVQIGSVCAYPKDCPVPFHEDDLWSGYPEETNAPYGITKRALGAMVDAYRAEYSLNGIYLIPVNLYGPGDNFDPESSHVIPALVRRFCEAVDAGEDEVTCWGTGEATREFLYVDDAAEAIITAVRVHNDSQPINLGTGEEISIADLASLIAELTGFSGSITWDASRPDGQPRRRLDITRATNLLGWQASTDLETGLRQTIDWWREVGQVQWGDARAEAHTAG
jgi:GDP-L-fucose synthase